MSINMDAPIKILVLHGVQIGEDEDIKVQEDIKKNIDKNFTNSPFSYVIDIFKYEDINDSNKAVKLLQRISNTLLRTVIGKFLSKQIIDLVGDVVVSLSNNSTAKKIRSGIIKKIEEIYTEEKCPCFILAHSLGSIYAFDIINALIDDNNNKGYFLPDDRSTWPVQGLTTIGSPIRIDMFRDQRQQVSVIGDMPEDAFFWNNIYDETDPVVSGKVFGMPTSNNNFANYYNNRPMNSGWLIYDYPIDTGKRWLFAHTAYWKHPDLAFHLIDIMSVIR